MAFNSLYDIINKLFNKTAHWRLGSMPPSGMEEINLRLSRSKLPG